MDYPTSSNISPNNKIAPVSAIIPCYHCADTIGRAVDSITKQTVLPTEIILVDDGSQDNTLETLLQLQRDYGKDWIKVIPLESNYGVSVARNVGWDLASQEYIAFLDADDAWHREKISVQYSWMLQNPNFVLSGHKTSFSRKGEFLCQKPILENAKVHVVSKKQLLISNVFSTSSVMIKRCINQRFISELKSSEDYFLWLEILLSGGQLTVIDAPLGYYFKELFGAGGLTKNLWKMELSELRVYWKLWQLSYVSFWEMPFLLIWSLMKYCRRFLIYLTRKLNRKIFRFSFILSEAKG